jgi:hypothetical protein
MVLAARVGLVLVEHSMPQAALEVPQVAVALAVVVVVVGLAPELVMGITGVVGLTMVVTPIVVVVVVVVQVLLVLMAVLIPVVLEEVLRHPHHRAPSP